MPSANVPAKSTPTAVSKRRLPRRDTTPIASAVDDRGDRPADVQRDPGEIGDDEPRERGVADRIADEREALEHDEGAHHRADDADDQRRYEAPLHEAVGQRIDEQLDHRRASSW